MKWSFLQLRKKKHIKENCWRTYRFQWHSFFKSSQFGLANNEQHLWLEIFAEIKAKKF